MDGAKKAHYNKHVSRSEKFSLHLQVQILKNHCNQIKETRKIHAYCFYVFAKNWIRAQTVSLVEKEKKNVSQGAILN